MITVPGETICPAMLGIITYDPNGKKLCLDYDLIKLLKQGVFQTADFKLPEYDHPPATIHGRKCRQDLRCALR